MRYLDSAASPGYLDGITQLQVVLSGDVGLKLAPLTSSPP